MCQARERSLRWAGLTQWLQLNSYLIQSFKSLAISTRVHAPASLFKMIQVFLMKIWSIIQCANWHGIPGSACKYFLSVIAVSSGSSPKSYLFPLCRRLQPCSRTAFQEYTDGCASSRNAQHCFWKGFLVLAPASTWGLVVWIKFAIIYRGIVNESAQGAGQPAPSPCPALGFWSWPGWNLPWIQSNHTLW